MNLIRDFLIKRELNKWRKNDNKNIAIQVFPQNITEILDVAYTDSGNKKNLLDIYYPSNVKDQFPVIIHIHGGGFIYGDKELSKLYCMNLAQEGYIVFNIDYRLAFPEKPDVKIPDQIYDAACAVNWICKNIKNYLANQEKVYLTGDSAGSYLAIMTALVSKSERLRQIFNTPEINLNIRALGLPFPFAEIENDKGPFAQFIRPMVLKKGYKEQEYYKNMMLKNLPEIKDMPLVFIISSEDDYTAGFMLPYLENVIKLNNVKYELLYYSKKPEKVLWHCFSIYRFDWEEAIEAKNKMLNFFSQA